MGMATNKNNNNLYEYNIPNNIMNREHSEFYAEEIDRLPNEPDQEYIPQNNHKNVDNIIEINDVNVDVED